MSELDFQKIFASGASSQIDWTDDNYLKGWGYLGNVPPSYQSFDSLQRLNDLKFKYLYDEFMGIETNTEELISNHNENSEAHKTLFDKKLDKNGGTVTGNLNASGYNITATKFIGNLQGKADSAANADLATKANQDSQGQVINTTYVKGVTASNSTITVTKGNGTTSTTTINNVANATNAKIVSNTAGDGSATDLVTGTMAINDYFRIRIGGSSDAGYAEIATADNGNEPIYIRQYGGSNFGFSELIRTATILDSSGNTSFPGNVTAVGAMYSATPATTENSTRVATTAYVKNNVVEIIKKVYPVGSIYMSTVSTNPATLFGFGTWEAMPAGRVLLAQGKSSWGTTYNAGSTGGEATHKLTVGEMPSHNHTGSTNTTGNHSHNTPTTGTYDGDGKGYDSGGGNNPNYTQCFTSEAGSHSHTITIQNTGSSQSHNNMQPYIVCYIWKRVS